MALKDRVHGGPDARGPARWDFSTCANAVGPCPTALDAVRAADPSRYPDPRSTALREQLAAFHDVAPWRILFAASASEFIQRITAVSGRLMPGAVEVPPHAYGDYAHCAQAWERAVTTVALDPPNTTLRWYGEPSSPLGQDAPPPATPGAVPTVLDAVYEPLRLDGESCWPRAARDRVFVMHGPNKALALTGIRGTYVIAPATASFDVAHWCETLEATTPSWPLSAHAVAMLQAWTTPAVQRWVADSRNALREWRAQLIGALISRGFECRPSIAPYLCVRPPRPVAPNALRDHGIAVRDATSFGLAGWWRVSAQPPQARRALESALDTVLARRP
jgi:histidinol-phosphate aminotransferase